MSSVKIALLQQIKKEVDNLTKKDNNATQIYEYITEHHSELNEAKFWRQVKYNAPKHCQDQDPYKVYIDSTESLRKPIIDLHDVEIQFFTWIAASLNVQDTERIASYLNSFFTDLKYWRVDILNLVIKTIRKIHQVRSTPLKAKVDEQLQNFRDYCDDEDVKKMRLFDKKGKPKSGVIDNFTSSTNQQNTKILSKNDLRDLIQLYSSPMSSNSKRIITEAKRKWKDIDVQRLEEQIETTWLELKNKQEQQQQQRETDIAGVKRLENTSQVNTIEDDRQSPSFQNPLAELLKNNIKMRQFIEQYEQQNIFIRDQVETIADVLKQMSEKMDSLRKDLTVPFNRIATSMEKLAEVKQQELEVTRAVEEQRLSQLMSMQVPKSEEILWNRSRRQKDDSTQVLRDSQILK